MTAARSRQTERLHGAMRTAYQIAAQHVRRQPAAALVIMPSDEAESTITTQMPTAEMDVDAIVAPESANPVEETSARVSVTLPAEIPASVDEPAPLEAPPAAIAEPPRATSSPTKARSRASVRTSTAGGRGSPYARRLRSTSVDQSMITLEPVVAAAAPVAPAAIAPQYNFHVWK